MPIGFVKRQFKFFSYHHVVFLSIIKDGVTFVGLFEIGFWIKKERLIPQTPSIRWKSHSYLEVKHLEIITAKKP